MRSSKQRLFWERFLSYRNPNGLLLAEEALASCHHAIEPGGSPNPYHLEGNVLTHTALAYWSLQSVVTREDELVAMAILCHDIGKPFSRYISPKGRATFIGHGYASAMDTPLLLKHLDPDITHEEMAHVVGAVAAHIDIYQLPAPLPLFQGDPFTQRLAQRLALADEAGSIITIEEPKTSGPLVFLKSEGNESPSVSADLHITMGLPGSGKSTWASSQNIPVFEYDAFLLKNAQDRGLVGLEYDQIFEVGSREKWKWQQECVDAAEEALSRGVTELVIDGTHLGHKRRKALYERFRGKARVHIHAFWRPVSECRITRGLGSGKPIDLSVFMRMVQSFTYPRFGTYDELHHHFTLGGSDNDPVH